MLTITKSMIQATQGLGNVWMVRKKSIIAFIELPSPATLAQLGELLGEACKRQR